MGKVGTRFLDFFCAIFNRVNLIILLFARFNRTRDDFDSLEAYNDFLEDVEDMGMYGT